MKQLKQRYERVIKHRDEVLKIFINEFDFNIAREAGVYYSKRLNAEMAVSGTSLTLEFDLKNPD